MKAKLFNVLKWFFIILGVLFLSLIVLSFTFVAGIANISNIKAPTFDTKLKEIMPIVEYVENYFEENNKYPDKIENVKIKKDITYKYETSNNNTCYTIKAKLKKEKLTKEYQHCSINSKNGVSNSESYIEFNN